MIFRQTALERLSSPEQLDQAMKVTRPTGWLALGSLAGLLLAALGWGFFGGISEKVSGMGVFIRTGGVFGVQSVGAGRLMKVLVKPGDLVSANSVIANIILPDLEIRARNAERILSSAQKRYREVLDLQKLGQRLDNEDESFQGTTFESSLRWYGEEVGLLEERL